jgi:hypothetical protein
MGGESGGRQALNPFFRERYWTEAAVTTQGRGDGEEGSCLRGSADRLDKKQNRKQRKTGRGRGRKSDGVENVFVVLVVVRSWGRIGNTFYLFK